MGRGMTIAVLCAAAGGSVGGGLIALHVSPAPSPTPPSIGSATPPPPTPPRSAITAQPIPPPDPHAALLAQIQTILGHVSEWARAHPDAPCPDIAALGTTALDPWGHRLELTCTDQPADQIMGAVSSGPDGIPGNSDDVKSWNLGPTVTQLVQGRRWTPSTFTTKPTSSKHRKDTPSTSDHNARASRTAPPKPSSAASSEPSASSPPAPKPSIAPIDAGDGIPTRR